MCERDGSLELSGITSPRDTAWIARSDACVNSLHVFCAMRSRNTRSCIVECGSSLTPWISSFQSRDESSASGTVAPVCRYASCVRSTSGTVSGLGAEMSQG